MANVASYLGLVRDLMSDFGLLPIVQGALGAAAVIGIIIVLVKAIRQA